MNKDSLIEDAWLNLDADIDDGALFNPLGFLSSEEPEDFYIRLAWLLRNPQYFSFLCKQIFNIDILPTQGLILQEMWTRKFPMLIASRGFGKSFMLSLYAMMRALLLPPRKSVVVGGAFRQSKVLFEYMETIYKNAPLLRDIVNCATRRDVDRCQMTIGESTIV